MILIWLQALIVCKMIYEWSVNSRVVERVGNLAPSQSKGIAHEILYSDKLNVTRPELGVTKLSTKINAVQR